jgi:Ca2+-binding RTX toxin-like protein
MTDTTIVDSFNTDTDIRVRVRIDDSFNTTTNNDNRSYYYSDNDVTYTNITNVTNISTTTNIGGGNGGPSFPGSYYPAVNPGYGADTLTGACFGVSSNAPGRNSFEFYLGSTGIPTLYGTNFVGAYDRDVMFGIGGNDVLKSGKGTDVMYGGEGADIFVLKASDATLTPYADFVADYDALRQRDVVILEGIAPNQVYYDRVGVSLDGATVVSAIAAMDVRNGLCLGLVAAPEHVNISFLFCELPVVV